MREVKGLSLRGQLGEPGLAQRTGVALKTVAINKGRRNGAVGYFSKEGPGQLLRMDSNSGSQSVVP